MIENHIASGQPILYAGPLLFRSGRTDTPFSSMIGGRRRSTNSEIFIIGQTAPAPRPTDSVVSEAGSLLAPGFTPKGRAQTTNVTEIHTKSIGITNYSTGNRGMLSGPNLAGQTGNPASELDYQTREVFLELAQDLEYNFINGSYQYRNGDNTIPNKTRGIVEAITTNVMDIKGNELSWNYLNEMLISIADNGGSTYGLVLGCNTVTATQLAVEAKSERFEVITGVDSINGIAVTDIRTIKGVIRLVELRYLPEGTALILNIGAIGLVEQPDNHGNWYMLPLGKVGGGERWHIQGAVGLDHGIEEMHGKITGIAAGYTPFNGSMVFIANNPVPTTEVVPSLSGASLASAQVGVATDALTVDYAGVPTSDPTLTYQWQAGKSTIGIFNDIEGATEATYTPTEEQEGMYIRCEITASGTAEGSVKSNSRKVAAAE